MWTAILNIFGWLLGKITSAKEATTADLAAGKATAETTLANTEKANAVQSEAARARTGADLRVVQSIAPESGIDADANDKLAEQFPGQFRD